MTLSPETIVELLHEFFPVSAPGKPASLSNDRPNYSVIREFAKCVAELDEDFSERSIPLVLAAVQTTFSEEEQNRLTDNFPLIPYGIQRTRPRTHKRERSDWVQFVWEIRLALLKAIRPEQALFLQHVSHLSESDRTLLLDVFIREFLSPIKVQQVLDQMDLIERGELKSCQGGANDFGYFVTFDRVEFTNDGDGCFEDDEIIRAQMTFSEFRTALRDWSTNLLEQNDRAVS